MKMWALLIVLAGLIALAANTGCGPADPAPLDAERQEALASWLDAQGREPNDYVVGLFEERDVVFLGEKHRIRHDVLFVQSLLAPLHAAGVRTLATEFARHEDQPLIDSLLTAPAWDEGLAREIVFRQHIWWGYREYVDIFRKAWALNRSLPEGAPPCRILGVNVSPDWSFIKTQTDRDDPAVKRRVWRGGTEQDWAEVILDAVGAGEKVLVHSGLHHAFTRYRQPIVVGGEFKNFDGSLRCGNHVFAELGERAMTVCLHAPWNGPEDYGAELCHPAGGVIDALMLAIGPRAVGFDLAGGPFGEIRVTDAVYMHGYEDFKLADLCDGWIYTQPISEYEGVAPIPDWFHAGNLERAQAQSPNPRYRDASVERMYRNLLGAADIPGRFGSLR